MVYKMSFRTARPVTQRNIVLKKKKNNNNNNNKETQRREVTGTSRVMSKKQNRLLP